MCIRDSLQSMLYLTDSLQNCLLLHQNKLYLLLIGMLILLDYHHYHQRKAGWFHLNLKLIMHPILLLLIQNLLLGLVEIHRSLHIQIVYCHYSHNNMRLKLVQLHSLLELLHKILE